jgi:hypothetical protein
LVHELIIEYFCDHHFVLGGLLLFDQPLELSKRKLLLQSPEAFGQGCLVPPCGVLGELIVPQDVVDPLFLPLNVFTLPLNQDELLE